ncbi:MAG: 30S ribosomal protein S16 [bacterium]|nr:30S ribosomal protein S16 [bacterium]
MVKIRLFRVGGRSKPFYRIVAADARSPRSGRFIERLGSYDPKGNPAKVILKAERIHHWLDQGAQPTKTVEGILRREGYYRKPESTGQDSEKKESK